MLVAALLGSGFILFLGNLFLFLIHKISIYRAHFEEVTAKQKRFVIAILTPSARPLQAQHTKGFISHLKRYASFEFETIECTTHASLERTYQWAEYIADNNIDLVYTVGKVATDVAFNILKTRGRKIPIVSGAIALELCERPLEQMQHEHPFSVCFGLLNWPKRISTIKQIFPSCRKVLVLFRSIDEISHTNLKEKNSIAAALRKNHMTGIMHHISNIEKSTELNAELLDGVDLVIISRSSELMSYTSKIRDDAAQHNVPVFSTDITSSDVFIGINDNTERKYGDACAKRAIRILEDNAPASEIAPEHIKGPLNIVVRSRNANDLTATTVISQLLNHSQYVSMGLQQSEK